MATAEVPVMSAPALTPRADRAFRVVTTVSVALLALAAAVLSYSGLRDAALRADIDPQLAWLFPVVIDGLTFVGSVGVVYAVLTRTSPWYPWFLTLLGVGVSTTGNVAVSPDDWVSRLVHAAPPVVLALSLEAMLRVYRARAHVLLVEEEAKTSRRKRRAAPKPDAARKGDGAVDAFTTSPPIKAKPDGGVQHGRVEQAAPERVVPSSSDGPPVRQQVRELLEREPEISGAEVSRRLGIDGSYARRLLREEREDEDVEARPDERDLVSQGALFTA